MSCIGADISETYATLEEGRTPAVGDVYHGAGGKSYKFVQFSDGTGDVAAVAGNVVYYTAVSFSGFSVTSDLSDGNGIGAGVLQSAPADGEYCWIQVRGPATLTTALTAGADGNALTAIGATDGTLDVSGAVTDFVCAVADDASAKTIVCMFPL